METGSQLKAAFRTNVIISGSLVASLVVYAVLVELIKARMRPLSGLLVPGIGHQSIRYIFYGASVAAVVLVRLAGRSILRTMPGEDARHLIHRLSRAGVLSSALAELPAVFGFVMFLLIESSRDFYILLFVSLFLQFMYFPRLKAWQSVVQERFPQLGI